MKTLEQLRPLIIEWANNKELIKLENAPKQRLKLIEECGELASAILKNNVDEQKDAIGDIFVVLVILSEQLDSELNLELYGIKTINYLLYLNYILDYSKEKNNLYFSIQYLLHLSCALNQDLTECANIAWNQIKDRTGRNINGTFIKD